MRSSFYLAIASCRRALKLRIMNLQLQGKTFLITASTGGIYRSAV
jgi:hypothetical protein